MWNFGKGRDDIYLGRKSFWSGWVKGGVVDSQSIPALEIFVTNVAVISEHPPEVDRLDVVPDEPTARGFKVFAD